MSKQRSQVIEGLPAQAYIDPAVLVTEQDRIFAATWQYAGHVEKLQQSGDFFVSEIAGESIIVIRDSGDKINAFYNVCPHRAARLLAGEGCKQRFSCPYHGWTFGCGGELIAAPRAQQVPGFDTSNYALKACRVEAIHGLVFINLNDNAAPLRQQAPELLDDLYRYAPDLPELTFVHRTETCLEANWKVAVENYAECYHCELIHKPLVDSVLDFSSYQIRVFDRSQKHRSRPQLAESKAYDFDESVETEFVAWWLWPNFSFQSYPGGRVHVWHWKPLDVDRTHLTVDWYFPSRDMQDWERGMIEHHAATTFIEDQDIINSVQQGLSSRAYQAGPLMIDRDRSQYSEHGVAALQQWWREAMGETSV